MPDATPGRPGAEQGEWVEDLDIRPGQREILHRIHLLEHQIRENPTAWSLRMHVAQAYASDGNFAAAATHLHACRELVTDPEVAAGVFFNLGVCLEHLHRWREAAMAFEQCLLLLPELFWAHFRLGMCRMRLEEWQLAVDDLRRAAALDDREPELFRALRDALQQVGRVEEAGEAHCRLVELHPRGPAGRERAGERLPN